TRLTLERLEDRLAPATLTVTSNADDPTLAQDSLRAAVASIEHGADQNASIQRTGSYGSNDTIVFDLPTGQRTITLTSNDANGAPGPRPVAGQAEQTGPHFAGGEHDLARLQVVQGRLRLAEQAPPLLRAGRLHFVQIDRLLDVADPRLDHPAG